jgi:hypothetical protein
MFNKCQLKQRFQQAAALQQIPCCSSSERYPVVENAQYHHKISNYWDFTENLPDKPMFVEVVNQLLKVMFCV